MITQALNFILGFLGLCYFMIAGLLGCVDNKPFDEESFLKERESKKPHYEYKVDHWEVEWR